MVDHKQKVPNTQLHVLYIWIHLFQKKKKNKIQNIITLPAFFILYSSQSHVYEPNVTVAI